jgi:hypothetical protein
VDCRGGRTKPVGHSGGVIVGYRNGVRRSDTYYVTLQSVPRTVPSLSHTDVFRIGSIAPRITHGRIDDIQGILPFVKHLSAVQVCAHARVAPCGIGLLLKTADVPSRGPVRDRQILGIEVSVGGKQGRRGAQHQDGRNCPICPLHWGLTVKTLSAKLALRARNAARMAASDTLPRSKI